MCHARSVKQGYDNVDSPLPDAVLFICIVVSEQLSRLAAECNQSFSASRMCASHRVGKPSSQRRAVVQSWLRRTMRINENGTTGTTTENGLARRAKRRLSKTNIPGDASKPRLDCDPHLNSEGCT